MIVQLLNEPRQLLVGAALTLVTGIIQTFGVVALEELVDRIRDRFAGSLTRARMLGVLWGVIVYLFGLHLLEMALWAAVFQPLAGYRASPSRCTTPLWLSRPWTWPSWRRPGSS
jgi:hypothetical protein